MVISQVIEALTDAFPRHRDEITALAGSYRRVLGDLGPEALKAVWERTIDAWERSTPPRPAEFAKHRPAPVTSEQRQAAESAAMTKAAQAEHKTLIDRTLKAHAETIAAYAAQYEPQCRVAIGRYGFVTGADIVRDCVKYRVSALAWPLAVETARGGRAFAQVDLGPDDWRDITDRTETRIRGMRAGGGNAVAALSRPESPTRQAERARLRELAEQFHAPIDRAESA